MLLYLTIAVGDLHFFCSVSSLHEFPTNKIAEQGRLIFLREDFEVFLISFLRKRHVTFSIQQSCFSEFKFLEFFQEKTAWNFENQPNFGFWFTNFDRTLFDRYII
jgi:hypothetical protein